MRYVRWYGRLNNIRLGKAGISNSTLAIPTYFFWSRIVSRSTKHNSQHKKDRRSRIIFSISMHFFEKVR